MGIVILILFGIVVGMIANRLVSSPVPGGLIMDCVVGLVGSLLGAWIAKAAFNIHITNQVSSLSTWVSAILGAAVLLLAVRVVFGAFSGGHRGASPFHR